MLSLVIPVYQNSENIADLVEAMEALHRDLRDLEVVFVVDGSPDDSHRQLATRLPQVTFRAQLLALSRNFGTFGAMRAGLAAATGDCFAVMAADLQEPPELIAEFHRLLGSGTCDLVVGQRTSREDPFVTRMLAKTFWVLYRRFVRPDVPEGGIDIFACRREVRDHILRLQENANSLIGLLFWVGFRRATVPYARRKRARGRSAWTLRKRLGYMTDSIFAFSDLPIRLLFRIGVLGLAVSLVLALVVLVAKVSGAIAVPGYAATVLTIIFFGGLNCAGLGIVGGYVWRTFENSQQRPSFIVASHEVFPGRDPS